jgi:hypothetical protein
MPKNRACPRENIPAILNISQLIAIIPEIASTITTLAQ